MKKLQFLEILKQNLSHLPQTEVAEILRDQEEYIRDAVAAGRNEDLVIKSLGDPKHFAASLSAESKIHRAETASTLKSQVSSTLGAVFAILALAPLNLIFAFGPFMILIGLTLGGWGLASGSLLAAIALFAAFFFKLIFISVGFWTQSATFFFILGCIGASVLALILMYQITQAFVRMTVSYLKWNLNFIKGKG